MAEELRELRISQQLPAKAIVTVVKGIYPKYDKTLQSKCERGDEYGVQIRPDALNVLYAKFAPEHLEAQKKKRDSGHRLHCRISCRLEDDDYIALKKIVKADGFDTMQDWLSHMVRQHIKHTQSNNRLKGAFHND